MTPEQMRIAIAEACGWRLFYQWMNSTDLSTVVQKGVWYLDGNSGHISFDMLPDYLSDLNAIHEAEKVLPYKQLEKMHAHLAEIVVTAVPRNRHTAHDFIWHATAAQRAEAFLRTIGKYETKEGV